MSDPTPDRWSRLWREFSKEGAPAGSFEHLAGLYSEPHRHYHNFRHIADCLAEFDRARHLARDPLSVELAIWFHDAVYDTRAPDNEERSAQLSRAWLGRAKAEPALMDAVNRLIVATKRHDYSVHSDGALLMDVDLAIFGQPPERFWEYEQQIRDEYHWVNGVLFAAKRAEILNAFLARDRIYKTNLIFDQLETQARKNLKDSVQRLSHTASS